MAESSPVRTSISEGDVQSPEALSLSGLVPSHQGMGAERDPVLECGTPSRFCEHALEHTLSFQRRVHAIKADFLWRGRATPLGITQDFWDL